MNENKVAKMINWDHVSNELVVSVNPNAGEVLISEAMPMDRDWHEIKRPIKLEDGAWYAITVKSTGCKACLAYIEGDDLFGCGSVYHKAEDVIVVKRIPESIWDGD